VLADYRSKTRDVTVTSERRGDLLDVVAVDSATVRRGANARAAAMYSSSAESNSTGCRFDGVYLTERGGEIQRR